MEKVKSHFGVNFLQPANRNRTKIRNRQETLSVQGQKRALLMHLALFHFISENEIIHILRSFIET